jgi:hypothetical protein
MFISPDAAPYTLIGAAVVGGAVAVWKFLPKVWKTSMNGSSSQCRAIETVRDHRDLVVPIMRQQTEILSDMKETLAVLADRTRRRI